MTQKELQDRYISIRKEYRQNKEINVDQFLDKPFHYQYDENVKNCDILFLGINPAEGVDTETDTFYTKEDIETGKTDYYKPFFDIQKELEETYFPSRKITWTHFDIFPFKKTKQSFITDKLLKTQKRRQFLHLLASIAKERIIDIQPKIIVVSNALVRTFMGKDRSITPSGEEVGVWMDFKFQFDINKGTDLILSPDILKQTPVLFTSMLSGQRALDKGSRERLVWHRASLLDQKEMRHV